MKIKNLIIIGAISMLFSCGNSLKEYRGTEPKADLKEFFNGEIKAWGIIQDWRGRVTQRFDVDMVGKWTGNDGVLEEEFRYYDGKKQQRTWNIKKIDENNFEGTAGDIIGKATGESLGSAINWHYEMEIPVDDKKYKLKLDDWMWQMNDDVLINRSYIKKFGITVAELTIFMQKQNND
jgi:hypothetical protein